MISYNTMLHKLCSQMLGLSKKGRILGVVVVNLNSLKLRTYIERRNADPVGIRVIEMSVRPTLRIIPSGHHNSGARLLTPLGVDTIVIRVIKVTMET